MAARGRAQQRIKRVITTGFPFVKNAVMTIPLPRNYDIETLIVVLRGTYTSPTTAFVNGSNGFGPAVRSDCPFGLLPRVEIVLEGRQTIFSVPARMLGMANVWRRRQPFYITNVDTFNQSQNPPLLRNAATATTAIAVNTAYNITCAFEIDFQSIKGVRPKDTNLRSGGLQTFDLRLTGGDETALFYQPSSTLLTTPFSAPAVAATLGANSGGVTSLGNLSNVTLDVFDVELEELRAGDGTMSTPGYVMRWTNQFVAIPANNSQQELLLPTDNFIAGIVVSPTVGGEAVDTVLNNVIARRGTDQRLNLPWLDLAALNERDYEHQRFPGYGYIDFVNSGGINTKIADAWNVQGGADTRLVLSSILSGANVGADVTTIEMIPVSAA